MAGWMNWARAGVAALLMGAAMSAQAAQPPAVDELRFTQDWDLSDLKKPARLRAVARASGPRAEAWRAALAAGRAAFVAQQASLHLNRLDGLVAVGEAQITDDREANVIELGQSFERPLYGDYTAGQVILHLPVVGMEAAFEALPDPQQRLPFALHGARRVEVRATVTGPRDFDPARALSLRLGDKHFTLQAEAQVAGRALKVHHRYERLADAVLPADQEAYVGEVLRYETVALVSGRATIVRVADLDAAERAAADAHFEPLFTGVKDELYRRLLHHEGIRSVGLRLLGQLDPATLLAARVHLDIGGAANVLGDATSALAHAQAALKLALPPDMAAHAHFVAAQALLHLGRPAQALVALKRLDRADQKNRVGFFQMLAHYMLGQYAEAEALLREELGRAQGHERQQARLWLWLAVERQGRSGREATAPFAPTGRDDRNTWAGEGVRHLNGDVSDEAMLKAAALDADHARLRTADVHFYIGQRLAIQGRTKEAQAQFQRTVASKAVPYPEYLVAQWELQRQPAAGGAAGTSP